MGIRHPFLRLAIAFNGLLLGSCGGEKGEEPRPIDPDAVSSIAQAFSTAHSGYWKFAVTSGTAAADAYARTPEPGPLYNGSTVGGDPIGPRWSSPGFDDGASTFDGVNE